MAIVPHNPFKEIEQWDPFHRGWQPLQELRSLQREMDRLLERLASGFDGGRSFAFAPLAEMDETDEEVHLRLEIPGLEADDLDIEVTEDAVSISGERKSESKTEEKGVTHSEFHYGKFERMISLPAHVQSDRVKAEYKNGILALTLPKTDEEKKKVIKIKVT